MYFCLFRRYLFPSVVCSLEIIKIQSNIYSTGHRLFCGVYLFMSKNGFREKSVVPLVLVEGTFLYEAASYASFQIKVVYSVLFIFG